MEVLKLQVLVYKNFYSKWFDMVFSVAKIALKFKSIDLQYEIKFVEHQCIHVEVMMNCRECYTG